MKYTITELFTLCPTLTRNDINTEEAINAMCKAHIGYKPIALMERIQVAIDYLLTIQSPPKKELSNV